MDKEVISKKLYTGLILVMFNMGIGIAFFVIILMTPDFTNFKGAGGIFVLLAIGLFYGTYEIDQVDKWIRKKERTQ